MPLLRGSAATVLEFALADQLGTRLERQFRFEYGYRPSPGEIRSWTDSIPTLMRDIHEAGIEDVEVLIEYQLPYSGKRADVVLCGRGPTTRRHTCLIVELKQWSHASLDHDDTELVHVDAYRNRTVLHPATQVDDYVAYLKDFMPGLDASGIELCGAAYLHNADLDSVSTLITGSEPAPMFTASNRGEWLKHLRTCFDGSPGAETADLLLAQRAAPSKELMDLAAAEIQDREQFVLLDEQKVAYRSILNAVRSASESDTKTVIVVTGGPGTGKSVIALSALGELWRRGISAVHATGSRAFTTTLRKVAGRRNRRVQGMFKYFNSFITAQKNSFDVLIADEAHRIRQNSNNRYTPRSERSSKRQIDELIDIARVPVFLLDEHQVVKPDEIGTVEEIENSARSRGLPITRISLDTQFRNGGSDAYLEWVVRLLGLDSDGPVQWVGDENYQLSVAETPSAMEAFLAQKLEEGSNARMVAGYCWRWSSYERDRPLALDVKIGHWERPWNNREDRAVEGAPPTALWATQEGGFGQVGCIYTAQGFEYPWSGVIIGPDLVWRDGRFVSQPSESRDPAFRGSKTDFDRFVRNVYKVLLTRGMRGTIIYSTDPETRDALRELITGGQ